MKVATIHEWLVKLSKVQWILREILCFFQKASRFLLFHRLSEVQRSNLLMEPRGESFLGELPVVKCLSLHLLSHISFDIEFQFLSDYDFNFLKPCLLQLEPVLDRTVLSVQSPYAPSVIVVNLRVYFPWPLLGRSKKIVGVPFLNRRSGQFYTARQHYNDFTANSDSGGRKIA